jgi:AcrR family transcriptional regulator
MVSVWERAEPAGRPAPVPLSRDRIVQAAIAIADAEGLAFVSLRKVGAALDAGPMRLYGYISTKDELLDLMVDAVYGEFASADAIAGSWRAILRELAQRAKQAARKHEWFVELLGGRPHQGPNALAHLEASLAALSGAPGLERIDSVLLAVKAVNAYVIGALQSEARELAAERLSGMNKGQWQLANWPYLKRMIATGRFPTIAKVVQDAAHPPDEVAFAEGLELVLDGVAARLARDTRRSARNTRRRES